jgi:hypothetical protein
MEKSIVDSKHMTKNSAGTKVSLDVWKLFGWGVSGLNQLLNWEKSRFDSVRASFWAKKAAVGLNVLWQGFLTGHGARIWSNNATCSTAPSIGCGLLTMHRRLEALSFFFAGLIVSPALL